MSENEDPLGLGVHGQWGSSRSTSAGTDPSSQANRATPPPPGFRFEYPRVPIDWKQVATAPIKQISRRGDATALSSYLPLVALGDLSNSGGNEVAHPALLKAFQTAQLATQYLVHCQVSMENQLNVMAEDVGHVDRVMRAAVEKEERREKRRKELVKEGKSMKRLIGQYHRMLRKHNPGLAKRIVTHGDGKISLVEKDNVYAKGGVVGERERGEWGEEEEEEEDHFFTGIVGGEEGSVEEEEEEEKLEVTVNEETSAPSLPDRASSPDRAALTTGSREGPQSPEGALMRSSLTSFYTDAEREDLVKNMSQKGKREPIMEALRSSGAFDGSDSEEEGAV